MLRPPPRPTHRYTLFPYTTLFRSRRRGVARYVLHSRVAGEPRMEDIRSEEHTSELQSHSGISYAVFCLKKKTAQEGLDARRLDGDLDRAGLQRADQPPQIHGQLGVYLDEVGGPETYTPLYTLSLHDALPI